MRLFAAAVRIQVKILDENRDIYMKFVAPVSRNQR